MARLTYKCNFVKEKRPKWLQLLTHVLMNAQRYTYVGKREEFEYLKRSVDLYLGQLRLSQLINSRVTTEIMEDSRQTVLFVKRNGIVIVSIYIKQEHQ